MRRFWRLFHQWPLTGNICRAAPARPDSSRLGGGMSSPLLTVTDRYRRAKARFRAKVPLGALVKFRQFHP
jgi:hypothetical protein